MQKTNKQTNNLNANVATRWVFKLQNQTTTVKLLSQLFFQIQENFSSEKSGNWDVFSRNSLTRWLQENKKLSLAKHPPFLSDYDEIAGSSGWKGGLRGRSVQTTQHIYKNVNLKWKQTEFWEGKHFPGTMLAAGFISLMCVEHQPN